MDWLFPVALALTGTMGALMSLWGLWSLHRLASSGHQCEM